MSYEPISAYKTFTLGHTDLIPRPNHVFFANIIFCMIKHQASSNNIMLVLISLQNFNTTSTAHRTCQFHINPYKCIFLTYHNLSIQITRRRIQIYTTIKRYKFSKVRHSPWGLYIHMYFHHPQCDEICTLFSVLITE